MSVPLADVLKAVQLEAGKVYRCQVGDLQVEVRVERSVPDLLPAAFQESDVMLDPWTDFPELQNATLLDSEPADRLPPDVPQIPIE